MEELKIEYLPVGKLKPYKNNARKHADEDVNAIVESIKEFGFDDPIGVWGDDNTIVEGHGRLIAAKKLGMETVPVIRLDHLSDEQRRAYALAHNRTAELSEWDMDLRDIEIESFDIDMTRFGFDSPEFDFSEDNLNSDKEKTKVIVQIAFNTITEYQQAKEQIDTLCDSINANVSVKME